MIKTVAAWVGLALALAILIDALDLSTLPRVAVYVAYGLVVGPIVYRQTAAILRTRHHHIN